MTWQRAHLQGQGGYTLVELIVTTTIAALVMAALVSVFLTTTRATIDATSRVEASSQVRNFEIFAYDDFTGSGAGDFNAGCRVSSPCQSLITLNETHADQNYTVSYSWDQTNQTLDRSVGGNPPLHAATNVQDFRWYVDTNQSVVLTLKITVGTYTESQTFRFYPRRNP